MVNGCFNFRETTLFYITSGDNNYDYDDELSDSFKLIRTKIMSGLSDY